ncbi:hypothetical protein [Rufibacter hautae]|uniref:Uncharacterized protein n=1 Tax=Rufibacter hautae TaxID=2595005 RepID=A0A5B6TCV0_9BACT|nr:hypothetical protein [Rufibacter hautae]KAA3436844.1 hypothetical protein FOA19_20940 [Rufibacter hautae]
MTKGFIAAGLFATLVLLSVYLFRANSQTETISINYEEEIISDPSLDPSIVAVFDEDGNLEYSRQDTARETTKQVNTSLNGLVFYKLAHGKNKGYVKTEVFKYDYRKEDYYVTFSNDTVSASTPFKASISLSSVEGESAYVTISHPEDYSVEKEEGEFGVKFIYKAKSPQVGVNTFEGKITLQEKQYPIRFNYYFK